MNSKAVLLVAFCMLWASVSFAEDPYDFRKSDAYGKLSKDDRNKLEQVHRDLTMLWGALDRYADGHNDNPPETLDQLVPLYLSELPTDPFATAETASQKDRFRMKSRDGWGYRYRKGAAGNRAWIVSSVGLHNFPYLAARDNIGLYLPKGDWAGGDNAARFKNK